MITLEQIKDISKNAETTKGYNYLILRDAEGYIINDFVYSSSGQYNEETHCCDDCVETCLEKWKKEFVGKEHDGELVSQVEICEDHFPTEEAFCICWNCGQLIDMEYYSVEKEVSYFENLSSDEFAKEIDDTENAWCFLKLIESGEEYKERLLKKLLV